jgi:hypothetical protein
MPSYNVCPVFGKLQNQRQISGSLADLLRCSTLSRQKRKFRLQVEPVPAIKIRFGQKK